MENRQESGAIVIRCFPTVDPFLLFFSFFFFFFFKIFDGVEDCLGPALAFSGHGFQESRPVFVPIDAGVLLEKGSLIATFTWFQSAQSIPKKEGERTI